MALTDFTTNQGLRDVLLDMSTDRMNSVLSKFTLRESDVSILRGFWAQRQLFAPPADIAAIENIRTSNQSVTVHLYGRRAPGSGTQRKRDSTTGQTVFNFTPTFFSPIVEDFQLSIVNNALRQYMNEGADKDTAIRMAVEDEFMFSLAQAIKNIYVRADLQYRDFLEANKWALNTTADAGSRFTTYTGDAKRLSASERTKFFQDLQIELEENNFHNLALGRPQIYHTTSGKSVINDYLKQGPQNNENLTQFLGYFDPYSSNQIVNATGIDASFYAVAPGGVCGYARAFDYAAADPESQGGVSKYGEDSWGMINIGGADTMFFNNLPQLNIELKTKKGYQDNFSTYSIDEARIDITKSYVLTATFGAAKAPVQSGDDSPIIKYEIAQ